MFFGWTSICLRAKDLAASTRFYQALGMEVVDELPGKRVVLRNGPFRIALMNFLDRNLIHVRGADVAAVHAACQREIPEATGQPFTYRAADMEADADGMSWETFDPDGNAVFFDTNANETGAAGRSRLIVQTLRDAEQMLTNLGASKECLTALGRLIDQETQVQDGLA